MVEKYLLVCQLQALIYISYELNIGKNNAINTCILKMPIFITDDVLMSFQVTMRQRHQKKTVDRKVEKPQDVGKYG